MFAEVMMVVKRLSLSILKERFRLRMLEDSEENISKVMDGMPHVRGRAIVEKIAIEQIDARQKLSTLILIRAESQLELCIELSKIEMREIERQTLIYRYAYEKSMFEIASQLNYSIQSIRRFHEQGLKKCGIGLEEIQALEAEICC